MVAGECQHREMLREGDEGSRDGAGDAVAVEGDSEEVGERREGGRDCAGDWEKKLGIWPETLVWVM